MKRILVTGIMASAFLTSCVETEPVSPIPQVTFESLEIYLAYDILGNLKPMADLKFQYIDGDADLGMYRSDTVPDPTGWDERNYNLYLVPFKKVDAEYTAIATDSTNPPPYYKIWYNEKLDRVGQNKTVKGTVTITIEDLPQEDTIRFDFYIRDRANNKSNVESTSDLGTNIVSSLF
jgi:hypothetical protein